MPAGTAKHCCVGKRVQIPAYSDLWMRGARVGTVTRVKVFSDRYLAARDPRGADRFQVQLDHAAVKKPHWFIADDCQFV